MVKIKKAMGITAGVLGVGATAGLMYVMMNKKLRTKVENKMMKAVESVNDFVDGNKK